MKPWFLLHEAVVPGSPTPLRLYQRDDEFSIKAGGVELMNSRQHGSEESLAELGCAGLAARKAPRVLIGGLGMGFTLAAALDRLPPGARVTVSELIPAVVEWNRGPLGDLAGHPMSDGRVILKERDVAELIREPDARFDAILLDVDNGPDALTHPGNARLYSEAGLAAAAGALGGEGALAIWSVSSDTAFVRRLRRAGFRVEENAVRARGSRGARHVVWVARRNRPGP